jgi:hypothetical protein
VKKKPAWKPGAQGVGDSIMDRLAAKLDEMAVEQKRASFAVTKKIEEVAVEQKRVSFGVTKKIEEVSVELLIYPKERGCPMGFSTCQIYSPSSRE